MLHPFCTHIHTPSPQHLLPGLETLAANRKELGSRLFSSKEVQATLLCWGRIREPVNTPWPEELERSGRGLQDWPWTHGQPALHTRPKERETKAIFCSPHSQRTNLNGLLYNPPEIMSIPRGGEARQAKTALGLTGVTLPGRGSLKLNCRARAAPSPASFLPSHPPYHTS